MYGAVSLAREKEKVKSDWLCGQLGACARARAPAAAGDGRAGGMRTVQGAGVVGGGKLNLVVELAAPALQQLAHAPVIASQ